VAFKEKEPWKMKIGVDWIEEKNSKNLLKLLFKKYKKRNLPCKLKQLSGNLGPKGILPFTKVSIEIGVIGIFVIKNKDTKIDYVSRFLVIPKCVNMHIFFNTINNQILVIGQQAYPHSWQTF
jgi:hypothetical protein